jgi:dTDP-4-dehydrorhamnose reductase
MRLLLTGASGQLGGYLLRELAGRDGVSVVAWSGATAGARFGAPLRPVDLADPDAVAGAFADARPHVVLHAAALARVADCQCDPERARRVNAGAAATLTGLTQAARARLVLVSTDLVFDGERGGYREDDPPNPHSIYGRTKAEAEAAALTAPRAAVARLSLLFGPSLTGRPTFFDDQVSALRGGRPVALFRDEWRTPLDLETAARALVALAFSHVVGLIHLGGPERLSRLEMGRKLAAALHADASRLIAADRADVPSPEPRPRDCSLDSSFWRALFPQVAWPTHDEALRRLLAAR